MWPVQLLWRVQFFRGCVVDDDCAAHADLSQSIGMLRLKYSGNIDDQSVPPHVDEYHETGSEGKCTNTFEDSTPEEYAEEHRLTEKHEFLGERGMTENVQFTIGSYPLVPDEAHASSDSDVEVQMHPYDHAVCKEDSESDATVNGPPLVINKREPHEYAYRKERLVEYSTDDGSPPI